MTISTDAPHLPPILRLVDVHKRFGGLHAVDGVGFDVPEGAVFSVIGPNGAGKSTLFNLIGGNIPLTSGRVFFRGETVSGKKPHRIARLGLSRTYQNLNLFHGMTALENVMVGCHVRTRAGFVAGMLNLPSTWREERKIRDYSLSLLEEQGLADLADADVANLSFGQQRGVEFARALAAAPRLLLMDEPAAGLNMYETARIGEQIRAIRDKGITVLLVEHDMSLVMDISDTICVINFGRKIAEGAPAAIQSNPDVVRIYLGGEEDDA